MKRVNAGSKIQKGSSVEALSCYVVSTANVDIINFVDMADGAVYGEGAWVSYAETGVDGDVLAPRHSELPIFTIVESFTIDSAGSIWFN